MEDCDHILVFKDGRIIEQGNYQELMALKSNFFMLAQGKWFRSNYYPRLIILFNRSFQAIISCLIIIEKENIKAVVGMPIFYIMTLSIG